MIKARSINCPAMQRLHDYLKTGRKTTAEIQQYTGSMAVHTDIAELRANGIPVGKAQYLGTTETGKRIFAYSLDATTAS